MRLLPFALAAASLAACSGAAPPPLEPRSSPWFHSRPQSETAERDLDHPRRPSVVTVPVHVGDLPLASDEAPLESELSIAITPSGWREAGSTQEHVRLDLRGAPYGLIEVGQRVGWLGGAFAGRDAGTVAPCGGAGAPMEPARWTTVSREGGAVVVAISRGWYDARRCSVTAASRSVARAAPLVPSAEVHAFLRCDDGCPRGEDLVLVLPATRSATAEGLRGSDVRRGPFSLLTVPLRPGMARSFVARVLDADVAAFRTELGDDRELDRSDGGVVVDVEVVQTSADPEPVAVIHVSEDVAPTARDDEPAPGAFAAKRAPSLAPGPMRDPRQRFRRGRR